MFDCIEGFCKIKFEQDDWFLRRLALVYVLERPTQAILNRSGAKEAILVFVHYAQDEPLQPVGQNFGYDLQTTVQQGDRSKVISSLR